MRTALDRFLCGCADPQEYPPTSWSSGKERCMNGIFPPDCPNCDNSCGKTAQVSKTEKRENPRNLNDFKGFCDIGVTGFEPAASWSRRAIGAVFR